MILMETEKRYWTPPDMSKPKPVYEPVVRTRSTKKYEAPVAKVEPEVASEPETKVTYNMPKVADVKGFVEKTTESFKSKKHSK
jgi:hypothetical protein